MAMFCEVLYSHGFILYSPVMFHLSQHTMTGPSCLQLFPLAQGDS